MPTSPSPSHLEDWLDQEIASLRRSILEADPDVTDAGNAEVAPLRRRSRLPLPPMGRLQDIARRAARLPLARSARVLEQTRRLPGRRRAGVLFYGLSIPILALLLGGLIGFLLKEL
jgi:hypothetical protein